MRKSRIKWNTYCFMQKHSAVAPETGAIFSDKNPDLIKVLLNWFRHEISYWKRKCAYHDNRLPIITKETDGMPAQIEPAKSHVRAFSDQTGLIIRAADELRILVAKSMSQYSRPSFLIYQHLIKKICLTMVCAVNRLWQRKETNKKRLKRCNE